jgi:hypothetical protein
LDAAAGLTDEEKRRLKGETPVAIPTVTVTPTVSVSLPKPADQPTAAPTLTEEGREATIRTLMQGEAESCGWRAEVPAGPARRLHSVLDRRPGTTCSPCARCSARWTYLGTAFGFQQWDGTQWRTIPEDDVEAYYDRAILAMRKRLSKRWKDAGKDRAAAMLWVKEALEPEGSSGVAVAVHAGPARQDARTAGRGSRSVERAALDDRETAKGSSTT